VTPRDEEALLGEAVRRGLLGADELAAARARHAAQRAAGRGGTLLQHLGETLRPEQLAALRHLHAAAPPGRVAAAPAPLDRGAPTVVSRDGAPLDRGAPTVVSRDGAPLDRGAPTVSRDALDRGAATLSRDAAGPDRHATTVTRADDRSSPSGRVGAFPAQFGAYAVERCLAEGGMGAVYVARHVELGRQVAIKVMRKGDARQRQRFATEALATAKLNHPHIVAIHEAGQEGQTPYLVMDYVVGESLHERLAREGPLDGREAARLTRATWPTRSRRPTPKASSTAT